MADRVDEALATAEEMDWPDDRPYRRYPWSEWEDGGVWCVWHSEDFDAPVSSMQSMLHQRATKLNRRVRTKRVARDSDAMPGLQFQFLDLVHEEAAV